ncbi:integrase catalytic domain-containing protein [Leptospira levettii]|uniref:integrase catalytic domain-containing protein n=1 Tax=Leptospira levettii TaxID=2023178 RepID=UPI00223CDA80|nr:transposase family protein [Leptospira levettii]MCW7473011.1 DDE-type integrase/transposase/recombinase [Leptospira levettii]MCW7473268.1 DDE-type integrase/transposase/recombinase [Leptospira levettii]
MSMKQSKTVRSMLVQVFKEKYLWASKKEKSLILDQFVEATGFNRSYARTVLRKKKDNVVKLRARKKRISSYDDDVRFYLEKIWEILDRICGKRLVMAMPDVLAKLEQFKVFKIDKITKDKLLSISSASVDRLLKPARKKLGRKGTSTTKQPKYLIDRIPIKTFGEWKSSLPGFVQIDLVAHNGGNVFGGFYSTLAATDVCTGWTVCILVKDKTQFQMLKALIKLKKILPFPLLGIHSDNGAEFINQTILTYAERNDIQFTRGRPYKKNDNPHIEQKNYSVVRRNTGYLRIENQIQADIVRSLYQDLNTYNNYFLPVMILKEKHRIGSKAIRKYDEAKSPYRRILDRKDISKTIKASMKKIYEKLNIFELKNQINHWQNEFVKIAAPIRNPIDKVNVRRKRGILHTTPKWRREVNSDTKNPFLERQRVEEMRRAAEQVWVKRK